MEFLKGSLPVVGALFLAGVVMWLAGSFNSAQEPTPASPSLATSTVSVATASVSVVVPENLAVISARHLAQAGANLLASVVNIFCTAKSGNGVHGASGTGVIIDSRGLILTVAHVGEYFLLADGTRSAPVTCVIRKGSPATDAYDAKLVYLSPSWLSANANTLIETAPKGTGENDFAVLAITGSHTDTPLPTSFPSISLGTDVPKVGERVVIGAYAAQYLGSTDVKTSLYPTLVFDPITNRYTFSTTTIDLISIKGTAAAQEGSSGGALVDEHNQIVGLIATSKVAGALSDHVLNAISSRHIRTSFMNDMRQGFDSYFASRDIPTLIDAFSAEASTLRAILSHALY